MNVYTLLKPVTLLIALSLMLMSGVVYSESQPIKPPIASAQTATDAQSTKGNESEEATEETMPDTHTTVLPDNTFKDVWAEALGKDNANVWFALACGFFGMLLRLSTYLYAAYQESQKGATGVQSFVDNFEKEKYTVIWWYPSSIVAGFIAINIHILETSTLNAIIVGASWPTIFESIRQTIIDVKTARKARRYKGGLDA